MGADVTTASEGLPQLFAHPFSSYCWKVLIALWENDTPFTYRSIVDPVHAAEWERLSALGKMPLLVDGSHVVPETTIIIEHLALTHPGPVSLIPRDATVALEPRLLDRMADAYLMDPTTALVGDRMRVEGDRDPVSVAASRALLDRSYAWWNGHMTTRHRAAGDFGLADCAFPSAVLRRLGSSNPLQLRSAEGVSSSFAGPPERCPRRCRSAAVPLALPRRSTRS